MAKSQAVYIGHSSVIQINAGANVQVDSAAPVTTHPSSDNYDVLLINMTNLIMVQAQINNNKWFTIPTTPRNCYTDCDTCHANQNWQAIVGANCHDAPFELTVATKFDSNGHARGAKFTIRPHCDPNVRGGVICIVP